MPNLHLGHCLGRGFYLVSWVLHNLRAHNSAWLKWNQPLQRHGSHDRGADGGKNGRGPNSTDRASSSSPGLAHSPKTPCVFQLQHYSDCLPKVSVDAKAMPRFVVVVALGSVVVVIVSVIVSVMVLVIVCVMVMVTEVVIVAVMDIVVVVVSVALAKLANKAAAA